MNSTYDYDPASRKDELLDIIASVLDIVVPFLRPDIAILIGAFPWCECISFSVSCLITKGVRVVLRLPSWFPGMSIKREMAIAREYSKQYLERPFEYALQKTVMALAIFSSCAG